MKSGTGSKALRGFCLFCHLKEAGVASYKSEEKNDIY